MPGLKHHILGLTGFAGAGKDTVADLLVEHARFRKIAFADALKAELCAAFHVEPLIFTRHEYKREPLGCLAFSRCLDTGYIGAALQHLAIVRHALVVNEELIKARTPRETMQLWGTQYRRAQDENYWAAQVRRSIAFFMDQMHERNFVVTDCRFANEVDTLRKMGGWIWQVTRPGLHAGNTPEGLHASATDGSQFAPDVVLNNSHHIRHLQQLVLQEYWGLDSGLEGVEVRIPAPSGDGGVREGWNRTTSGVIGQP
jgi:hypothetical protein